MHKHLRACLRRVHLVCVCARVCSAKESRIHRSLVFDVGGEEKNSMRFSYIYMLFLYIAEWTPEVHNKLIFVTCEV